MNSQLDYRLATLSPRLSDWTGVGYQGGAAIPDRPATITFPAGVTVLTTPLKLKSGDVVRGAGREQTILRCPALVDAIGQGAWFAGGQTAAPGWSTGGGWLSAENGMEIGIEDLTIEFPAHPAAPHFWERGFNGIFFSAISHAWVRRVRIVNPDSGLLCYRLTNVTMEDVEIVHPDTTPNAEGHVGHYGVMLGRDCTSVLVTGLRVSHRLRHDTDVANGAHHNVIEGGRFADYACSHHGGNPHHNLFTDIDCGAGTRVFADSGGNLDAMPHNGPGEVFWHLRKSDGTPLSSLPPFTGSRYWGTSLAIVGHVLNRLNTDLTKEWIEGITPVEPANVYRAQRGEVGDPPSPPPEVPMLTTGDRIEALAPLIIRSGPAKSAAKIGDQPTGAQGVLGAGPTTDAATGIIYWQVNFDSGIDGYCGEDRLKKVVAPIPSPPPPPTTLTLGDVALVHEDATGLVYMGLLNGKHAYLTVMK